MDTLLQMSAKELSRLEVMQILSEKRMSQKEAGKLEFPNLKMILAESFAQSWIVCMRTL